jgi:hypothetical protein
MKILMRAEGIPDGESQRNLTDRRLKALAIGAMVLIIIGVKLQFIQQYGSSVPFWDQWDAEGDRLYRAYLNSNLSFATLIASHNEHRILTSRLLSLVLFELSGGWDPILQMIANAALHVGAIIFLVLNIQRIIPPVHFLLLVLFSTLLFVLPIGWENLLCGFQPVYFVLIFSLLALTGFANSSAFSAVWWGSAFCATAAYFSMASGALTAAAALAVVGLQMVLGQRKGAKEYLAAIALLAASVVMVLLVDKVPGHDIYRSHSFSELFRALLRCLTFPWIDPSVGIWVNMPLAVYACAILAIRPNRQSPHWIVFGFAIWLFGQSLSLSFGRGTVVNSSRYLDVIIIGLPINFGILLLFESKCHTNIRKNVALLAIIVWLAIVVPGLIWNTVISWFPSVVEKGAEGQEQQKHVLAYLKSGDLAELQGKSSQAIPYPDPARLAALLSDPEIRRVLPDSIRPADVDEKHRLDRTFLKGKLRSLMLRIKAFFLRYPHIMIGLGVAFAFGAEVFARRAFGPERRKLASTSH